MATSLSNQIKAKLQLVGSPKVKLSNQSPSITNIQRVPMQGKVSYREGNTSQSPDDQATARGAAPTIQRIQMKNVAFMPCKGQSPISSTGLQIQQQQFQPPPNITNMNSSNNNDFQTQSKVSPQRIIQGGAGSKMIIPANQIKLVKKDGTSPSPEARQPSKLAQANQQNFNPNIAASTVSGSAHQHSIFNQMKMGGAGVSINGQSTGIPQKIASSRNTMKQQQQQQHSDDEATVGSDSEDKVQNLHQMKQDSTTNNFNRPKLGPNQQQQHQQQNSHQTLQQLQAQNSFIEAQKTQRAAMGNNGGQESSRIKIISQNKIRKSPSPPPTEVLKNQQPPIVTNIQAQIKQQQQQQSAQPQLATDFIKGMINQSRTNNNFLNPSTQKTIGISNCLKIKNTQQQTQPQQQQQQNFVKDMKKHGLIKDIQDVSQLNQLLSENSPVRQTMSGVQQQQQPQTAVSVQQTTQQIKATPHQRNYSPPPNFSQAVPTNILKIQTTNRDIQKQKAQESSPTQQECSSSIQQQQQQQDGDQSSYQFPFQRRARSLSLTKQENINNKMNGQQQKSGDQPKQQQQPTQQSKSPSPGAEGRNRPVVAKANFVIAQKGVLAKQQKDEDISNVFERNKEVDEWLMGSGESDATAGSSNNSIHQQQQQIKAKQTELERPVQPASFQNKGPDDCDDSSVEGEDDEEEDWMFKTFTGKGKKGAPKTQTARVGAPQAALPNRSRLNEQVAADIIDEDFDQESPFDLAPEMSKQLNNMKSSNLMLDKFVSECEDISQYIEKIDQYMENIY